MGGGAKLTQHPTWSLLEARRPRKRLNFLGRRHELMNGGGMTPRVSVGELLFASSSLNL